MASSLKPRPAKKIRETGGPTTLDIVAIADLDVLMRDGGDVRGINASDLADMLSGYLGGGIGDVSVAATHSLNQSIASSTPTYIDFDTEFYNTEGTGVHDTGSNPHIFTIPADGKYQVGANVMWTTDGSGDRVARLVYYSVANADFDYLVSSQILPPTSANGGHTIVTERNMIAGDYIRLQVFQSSGGSLNILASGSSFARYSPIFWLRRMA